jgi:proline iminopeptidase
MSLSPADYAAYLGNTPYDDRLSGSLRRIPVMTGHGTFGVWNKRFGNNPRIKLLPLHGVDGQS